MSGRLFKVLKVAAALIAVVLLVQCARAPFGAKATAGTGTLATPWGEPDLQGIWTKDTNEPLQRPTRYKDREFLTDEERAELNQKIADIVGRESDENRRPRGTEQDVSGGYSAAIFTSHLPVGRRTSMVVDPPDGRIPPLTEQEQKKRREMREYAFALLQATDVCKNKLLACTGGKYGQVSPRRAEAPPHYVKDGIVGGGGGAINRSDGPEDRVLSERCLASGLPDFGGFRRIVQSKGQVSIFYDVGQGQGWQRIIPITDGATSSRQCPSLVGGLAGSVGGQHACCRCHELLGQVEFPGGQRKSPPRGTVDARRRGDAPVHGHN